jgi:2-polyprenyl-3-methyl-5-hydroxy-6-metoxy-1,4-benzoquinol methylase
VRSDSSRKEFLTETCRLTGAVARWPKFYCPIHRELLSSYVDVLACPRGDRFPIVYGIPRFAGPKNYAAGFGAQWKKYRLTQLDSHSGVPITQERARRCLGPELWENLAGKHVLECGCGAGRFTEILLQRGALVTSVDVSDAVEANQENFPQSPAHRIAQADILQLPFQPGQFDIVFCLGVIQHTPKPEHTLAALSDHLRPGGTLVVDHYAYKVSEFTKLASVMRFVLKRLSPQEGLRCTDRLVDLFFPVHKGLRRWKLANMLWTRISPILCYYQAYPQLNDEMQYQWARLDTHDSLTCWYRRFRTRAQIERALKALGLENVTCRYGGNGIEGRGRKPVAS